MFLALTNYKKNGETFRNYLALKQLRDCHGVVRYVIGMQFDMTELDTIASEAAVSILSQHGVFVRWLPSVLSEHDLNVGRSFSGSISLPSKSSSSSGTGSPAIALTKRRYVSQPHALHPSPRRARAYQNE